MRIISATQSEIHIVLDTVDIGLDEILAGETDGESRIKELEARIKWLEGALTSVLQAHWRPQAASGEAAFLFATAPGRKCPTWNLCTRWTRPSALRPCRSTHQLPRRHASRPTPCALPATFQPSTTACASETELEAAVSRQPEPDAAGDDRPGADRPGFCPSGADAHRSARRHRGYLSAHLLERIVAVWRIAGIGALPAQTDRRRARRTVRVSRSKK